MSDYNPADPQTVPESPVAELTRRSRLWRLLSNRISGWIVAAVLLCAVIGLSITVAASPSATAAHPSFGSSADGGPRSGGAGSNARSGPAAGVATGTVSTVSTSGFTMSTAAGQKVTVKETSSTSAAAINTGENVLVLGTTNGTTITATQVIAQPTGSGSTTSSAAGVVPFQQGSPSTAKQVGQIPANYTEGSGTIVSGTTANKATEAALAAYPGGVVDRVVQLSNGEYEIHYIGVNWPHHIFVNQSFTVTGAD